jgi:predicted nucleic acid-binding protein
VVDAGPLIAMAKLNRLVLFSGLFKEVIVPQAVVAECTVDLSHLDAQRIREAIGHGPFVVVSVEESPRLQTYRQLLDPGEAHVLLLAEQRQLPVLMDERRGRREARRVGIELIGTGALLVAAKRKGLVAEVRPLLDALVHQGYRLSKGLQQSLLEMSGES